MYVKADVREYFAGCGQRDCLFCKVLPLNLFFFYLFIYFFVYAAPTKIKQKMTHITILKQSIFPYNVNRKNSREVFLDALWVF